ncbi:hypothetical protein B0H19DRAFT_1266619 [Mycena capillaripes]|nr:hypothetical protein B0H19DRAFT_1266619 [Mycena capillaripes]
MKWALPDLSEFHARPHTKSTGRSSIWPLAVIGGQSVLLAIAYGFFAALHVRGLIPLSLALSEFAQRNPQAKTYLVTSLATALSALSSYLFSHAVRHALLVYLSRPMSVSTLGFGILISRRSFIFQRRQLKWVFAAGVFFLATLGQTANWTSLLTPIDIIIATPLRGTEIDFLSETFATDFAQLWNATMGIQNSIDSGIASVMDLSGMASADAASASGGALIDFNNWVYSVSTRGVLPITLVNSADEDSLIDKLITTNTQPFPGPIGGSNFNLSVIQWGLSANFSCGYQQLDANSDPPLVRFTNQVEIAVGDELKSYTVSAVIIAIDGQSPSYDGTMVCTIVPEILTLFISYSAPQWVWTWELVDGVEPSIPAPATVSYAVISALEQALSYGQSLTNNVVTDSITTILDNQGATQASLPYMISYPVLMGAYIRGVIEFAGTAIKTDLASPTGPLPAGIPTSMRRNMTGSALTVTVGWEHNAGVNNAILIPSTFVAIASILIVLFAQCLKWVRGIAIEHVDFDPNEPLVLMAAASAGGMMDIFSGLTKEDLEEGGGKKVMLGQADGKDGLVQVR